MLLTLAAPAVALDDPVRGFRLKPLILQLQGTVGPDKASVAKAGFTTISFGFLGEPAATRRWLGVMKAMPLGDYPALGKDILDALAGYEPNLNVVGPPALARKLLDLPAGAAVTIEGLADRGSRTYHLRSVEPGAAP